MSTSNNCCKELQSLIVEINCNSFLKLQSNDQIQIGDINAKKDSQDGGMQQSRKMNEDNRQGIIHAQITKEGSVVLKLSLLAAGFVIGPGGKSINDISMKTASQTTSWTFTQKLRDDAKQSMDLRVIVISGPINSIIQSIKIIQNAVAKYKQLVEESSPDMRVNSQQYVDGIEFVYKPPPLKAMPWAARTFSNNQSATDATTTIICPNSATERANGTLMPLKSCSRVQSEPIHYSRFVSTPLASMEAQQGYPVSPYCYASTVTTNSPPSSLPSPPTYSTPPPAYSTPPHTPRYITTTPTQVITPRSYASVPNAAVSISPSTTPTPKAALMAPYQPPPPPTIPMLYQYSSEGQVVYGNACIPQTYPYSNYYFYPAFH